MEKAPSLIGIASLGPVLLLQACNSEQDLRVSRPIDARLTLPAREPGELDIHHISTNRGNATLVVMPDGTTLLVDVGDFNGKRFAAEAAPLEIGEQKPNAGLRPGQFISNYLHQFSSAKERRFLDYLVVTHFHGDHYGEIRASSPKSRLGDYYLSGVTDVAEALPIWKIIDRSFPEYDLTGPKNDFRTATLKNYAKFIQTAPATHLESAERIDTGSKSQIRMRNRPGDYPGFEIRNVYANGEIWTGPQSQTRSLFNPQTQTDSSGSILENPLSIALKISYGNFDYFTGGDIPGFVGPDIRSTVDVESAIDGVVGEVDALSLNHHGNRDAGNPDFLAALHPRVVVQQGWASDQPGQELVHRLVSQSVWKGERDIFSTFVARSTRATIGSAIEKNFRSFEGHVVIRVSKGGSSYRVFVLDDETVHPFVRSTYGPYESRN